jgi:PAS domain S-box-containing protein
MPEQPQIYSSRILKPYVLYLKERYPDVEIESILRYAGVSRHELDDPGHWFNQQQVDRFHGKAVELTGNMNISREVARYAVLSDSSGPVKQHVLGLLNVSSVYLLMAKLYTMLSQGANVSSRKISSNQVEIDVVPRAGVEEKPYQCENRIGFFEALALLHTKKKATVEHDQCLHKGDDRCKYLVTWEEPVHPKWKRLFFAASALELIVLIMAVFFGSIELWFLFLAGGVGVMGLVLRAQVLEKKELTSVIQDQGNAAEDHIREIDYRYRGARLVQKIGQATSTILDMEQLAKIVIKNIQDYLDFDRGIMMLADKDKRRLVYTAGFGFEASMEDLLAKMQFRLDNPDAKGIFISVFNSQHPVLVDDISVLRSSFSRKSQQLIDRIGSKSLICLPIVHEGNSLGILAVDNIITKRQLTKSDVSLLMGVAYQTALSLFSAKAFKELQSSEERFRSLYENAPTAYISISTDDAVIVNCNAAAIRLFGSGRKRLIGSSLLSHVAPNKKSQQRAQWMFDLLTSGQPFHNEIIELIDSEGKSFWVHISLEPFRNSKGLIVEGRCIIVDITKQKCLENKLQRAQRMEAIGTLAGGVAHDLSNILSAIVSYPDLLLMDVSPDSPLYDPLLKIKGAGHRAAAIVQDLLTLSRRGGGIADVVDLNETVNLFLNSPECEDLMERHPGVTIDKILQAKEVRVKGSPVHLTKTIMNIVFNAAEAIVDKGNIRITIGRQTIESGQHDPGEYAVLTVEDNGHGIAAEDIKHVFEPFFTKKMMGRSGTGLGMAIVWAAVEDHKGFIELDSRQGHGTTVRLFFPATMERQKFHIPVGDPMQFDGKGDKVLVVDDDVEHREIAIRMLTRLGYEVEASESGEAAIAKFEDNYRPDLVMLDMMLGGGLDGLETYRAILKLSPGQKAIISSGYSESLRVKKARTIGVGAYVKKPYSLKEIGAAVRYTIDRSERPAVCRGRRASDPALPGDRSMAIRLHPRSP